MAEGTDCVYCGKGVLWECKRITFGRQKESFWSAKGLHLGGKRGTFGGQKESFLTLTDFTLHFSYCFTKLLHSHFIPLLNNFTC